MVLMGKSSSNFNNSNNSVTTLLTLKGVHLCLASQFNPNRIDGGTIAFAIIITL